MRGGAPSSALFPHSTRLLSPTGVLLATGIGTSAVQIAASAPTTGTYTVIVGTNDGVGRNNDTGRYLLRLANRHAAFATSTGDEGGALMDGAALARAICPAAP